MAEHRQQHSEPPERMAADVSSEEQAERHKRLNAMEMESLGSSRRDNISKSDYPGKGIKPNSDALEASRRFKQSGTEEWHTARERKEELSNWTNAWKVLDDDGTAEERLDDIAGGQTHRIKLAEAEARARSGGDDDYGDPKTRHQGGHNTTRGDRARGGGVAGIRGRGDGRRGLARELTQRSMSTSLGPFETFGTRTGTTARDHGGKDKRITTPTPLSATAGSSSRGRAASRQAARSSVRSPPSSEQLPSSANRQVSAISQRSSTSNYEAYLADPETFMASYQSRVVRRQAATAADPVSSDSHASNTPTGAPGSVPQVALEPKAASSGEHSVTRESPHSTKSLADSRVVFSPEIDSAPVGVRVPTPPPPGATTLGSSNEGSYLDDLMGLEWQRGNPAAPGENAAEALNRTIEDVKVLDRSPPGQVISSSDAFSRLASLLPAISGELDPNVVVQLEALAARGLNLSQPGGTGRGTTSPVPSSRNRASSRSGSMGMNIFGLSDSRFAQPTALSHTVSPGQSTGRTEGLRTTWTRNVEAGDYEDAEDRPVIFGEHVYRSGPTSKEPTAKAAAPASYTTTLHPFVPMAEQAMQRMPQDQSVGRLSVSNPFSDALEPAGRRARDLLQVHPNPATEKSKVSASTSAVSAALPIAAEDPSSRGGLSCLMPAMLEPGTEAITQTDLLGSPPLKGNLTHSVYASSGHDYARQQSSRARVHTSDSDDIIGEHLLPNLQRLKLREAPGIDARSSTTAAHTPFTDPRTQTRFGSPAAFSITPSTAEVAAPAASNALALRLNRLSLETDSSEVAVGLRVAEEGNATGLHVVGRSEPPPTPSSYTTSAVPATFFARYGNAGRGRGTPIRHHAPQLPAFLANNPAPSSDPGAAAAQQYGLNRPRSPVSSRPILQEGERSDPVLADRANLQASIFAAPYTGPPSLNRPTINSSGFLKPSADVKHSESSRGMRTKKDPWDMARKHGSGL